MSALCELWVALQAACEEAGAAGSVGPATEVRVTLARDAAWRLALAVSPGLSVDVDLWRWYRSRHPSQDIERNELAQRLADYVTRRWRPFPNARVALARESITGGLSVDDVKRQLVSEALFEELQALPPGPIPPLWDYLPSLALSAIGRAESWLLKWDRRGVGLSPELLVHLDSSDREGLAVAELEARLQVERLESIAGLGDLEREAWTLTHEEELHASEAAERLGIDAGTFRTRLSRARKKLRRAM
jgi:RNA polymerase sigma factor (sigma-70 family)